MDYDPGDFSALKMSRLSVHGFSEHKFHSAEDRALLKREKSMAQKKKQRRAKARRFWQLDALGEV
jgi:hypothetical protein